jgi:hypothetical protein
MTPAAIVYALCALTSLFCAWLLLRAYQGHRTRLLLWSSVSFAGLALNNVLLFIDLIVVPSIDLSVLTAGTAVAAIMVLLFGLVGEGRG